MSLPKIIKTLLLTEGYAQLIKMVPWTIVGIALIVLPFFIREIPPLISLMGIIMLIGVLFGWYFQIQKIKKIRTITTDQDALTEENITQTKQKVSSKDTSEVIHFAAYGIMSNGTQGMWKNTYTVTNGYGEKPFNYNAAFFTNTGIVIVTLPIIGATTVIQAINNQGITGNSADVGEMQSGWNRKGLEKIGEKMRRELSVEQILAAHQFNVRIPYSDITKIRVGNWWGRGIKMWLVNGKTEVIYTQNYPDALCMKDMFEKFAKHVIIT